MVRLCFTSLLCVVVGVATPAIAHVGSPDVFYEGDAGPYHVFVTVILPRVIPGVAQVQVLTNSGDVREVGTTVTHLTGVGSRYAPVPDLGVRSNIDRRLFTSSLWLMEFGALRVQISLSGSKGSAKLSVPIASYATRTLPMTRCLGAILLVLAIALAMGAISIVGAALREATLPQGAAVSGSATRRGKIAMAVMSVVVAGASYLAFAWWSHDALGYARTSALFKPQPLELVLEGSHRLRLGAAESEWSKLEIMNKLIPDHDHLMHLFLVRTPAFDRFWHLHPAHRADGHFELNLPAMEPGHYDAFADVVDETGFPWTLVGTICLPKVIGTLTMGDDSGGSFGPIKGDFNDSIDILPDGTRVTWQHAALSAAAPVILRFEVENSNGVPAADLEPYMGMAAHVEIFSSDLSVFAHIHPGGSVPMAALMLTSNWEDPRMTNPMTGLVMPDGTVMARPQRISPEFSMPYGFPKPELYRVFVQFKRSGRIETAAFNARVH